MLQELLLEKWTVIRTGLVETAGKFGPGELSFRPFGAGYSVAGLMLHVAHEERIEVHWGLMRVLPGMPEAYDDASFPDVASILDLLMREHERTVDYLHGLSDDDLTAKTELAWGQTTRRIDQLWHTLEHEIHHRGELSLYLGLLGRSGLDA